MFLVRATALAGWARCRLTKSFTRIRYHNIYWKWRWMRLIRTLDYTSWNKNKRTEKAQQKSHQHHQESRASYVRKRFTDCDVPMNVSWVNKQTLNSWSEFPLLCRRPLFPSHLCVHVRAHGGACSILKWRITLKVTVRLALRWQPCSMWRWHRGLRCLPAHESMPCLRSQKYANFYREQYCALLQNVYSMITRNGKLVTRLQRQIL